MFNLSVIHYVRVGLHGPGWLNVLGMPPRADVPLSTPKAHATDLGWGPYLRTGSRRAPCVPRNRDHEEKPAAARQKLPKGENTHLDIHVCIYIYVRDEFLSRDSAIVELHLNFL